MKSILSIVSILIIINTYAQRSDFEKSDFVNKEVLYKKKSIPLKMKREIKEYEGQKLRIANPNKSFNKSDVRTGLCKKPNKRLIGIIDSDSITVLYYEQGGRGKHCRCLIFKKESDQLISIQVSPKKMDMKELENFILNGEYYQESI